MRKFSAEWIKSTIALGLVAYRHTYTRDFTFSRDAGEEELADAVMWSVRACVRVGTRQQKLKNVVAHQHRLHHDFQRDHKLLCRMAVHCFLDRAETDSLQGTTQNTRNVGNLPLGL
jgi:hypothetical protein